MVYVNYNNKEIQMIDNNIFNKENTGKNISIFLGEQQGLFDTINKPYPKLWKNYKTLKSLDWHENEFDYTSCNADFKNCSKDTYDIMIKTLSWQWEADSIASRSIISVLAPFISSSEALAIYMKISENEILHAATYSEIVRNSFDHPDEILQEILKVAESLDRLECVSKIMNKAYIASHEYALGNIPNNQETYNIVYMFIVALFVLERIQFISSFAVTFSICDTGLFGPFGKAVQKICQDELEVHCVNGKDVLNYEHQTKRGKLAREECDQMIKDLIEEVVESEFNWSDYTFSEGRSLVGLNSDILKKWVLYNAKDVYNFFGIKSDKILPRDNPLRFMENWMNLNKTQGSPQEEDIAAYKVGIMTRDDDNFDFDIDF
jgi:ribonucleoside-diphosphate reductase beta chain